MSVTVAFAGNPNVGKSTVFNALTGLRQHTGNWTGKTVDPARGSWSLEGVAYEAVDLPGIYSLEGGTPEERLAAKWLSEHPPDVLVIVLDATALERTLGLALELRALAEREAGRRRKAPRRVLCLNLWDEAQRLGMEIDAAALGEALSCPAVPTRADQKRSFEQLRRVIAAAALRQENDAEGDNPPEPRLSDAEHDAEQSAGSGSAGLPIREASCIAAAVTKSGGKPRRDWDRLILGKYTALPCALLLLFLLFYLTVRGANLPSALLEAGFAELGLLLQEWLSGLPPGLRSLLLDGIYGTAAKVTAVMLPPMAVFFPLFSLLEDLGLLPRLAFLLDRPFARCGSCGRQGLCMCMGCGCNAVGVTGCRILPNPKARAAAILTNAMTPCNGRFPTLILLSGFLLGGLASAPASAAFLTACMLLSGGVTLLTTALLRRTLLKGEEGSFVLELPPYRRPRLGQLLLRSVLDRTVRVLGRALCVAAPAGALIWLLNRLRIDGTPVLDVLARGLDPAAAIMGLNGTLLLAFLLSVPANELFLPLALLIGNQAAGAGGLALTDPAALFTVRSALCAALFTLFHWPCATTLLTIRHETGSLKWTALSALLPTLAGVILCMAVNGIFLICS